MFPILFQTEQVTVYTYGFTMAITLIGLYFLASKKLSHSPLSEQNLTIIAFLAVLSIWFGGWIWFVGDQWLHAKSSSDAWHQVQLAINVTHLARTDTFPIVLLFGGLLLGYCRLVHLAFWRVLDFLLPFFVLGYGVQRAFGCFSAGCCYGAPTDLPWAVQFPYTFGVGPTPGILVHPTQLYMAASAFLTLLILKYFPRCGVKSGRISGIAMMGIFGGYFVTFFFRGDQGTLLPFLWGMNIRQVFAAIAFLMGLALTLWATFKHDPLQAEHDALRAKD
ncbi:MAG: prolipoprotein diacylglyceryl transferase [Magnetococcus sp. DMHC-6]